ncbi:hypothetical protein E2C01_020940 [Portunus trituberculatus]|uniref:Uncharacterized protein n=1 Tax=Portunus trituberculatus TaxID=210409 RepID=A0A5B7E1H2_PORTR|nr:hypothetical protein [Portunus trituberculatus]
MQSSNGNQHARVAVVVVVVVTASKGKTVCYTYLTSLPGQHSPTPRPPKGHLSSTANHQCVLQPPQCKRIDRHPKQRTQAPEKEGD